MSYSLTSFSMVSMASTDSVVMAYRPMLLGELEDLAGPGFVLGNAHHAVVHRLDLAGGQLVLDLLDGLGRRVVVPLHIGLLLAQLLAGIELDDLAAGLGGLLDGLEDGEAVEGVGLAADEEPAGLAVLGDLVFGAQRERRGQGDGGATDTENEKVVSESYWRDSTPFPDQGKANSQPDCIRESYQYHGCWC